MTVALTSSQPGVLPVPSSIVIPAGKGCLSIVVNAASCRAGCPGDDHRHRGRDPVPADDGAQLQYRDTDPDEHTHRYPDKHTHEHTDGHADQHAHKHPDRHPDPDGNGDDCLYAERATVHLPESGAVLQPVLHHNRRNGPGCAISNVSAESECGPGLSS